MPKEFSAYDGKDPTAPLNLGQGGVGRRWNWYSREEAHNPMVADLPVTEWRKGKDRDRERHTHRRQEGREHKYRDRERLYRERARAKDRDVMRN